MVVEGFDLRGRRFCDPEGNPLDDVRVGVQGWELDVSVVTASDGGPRCARVDPPDLEWSIEWHTS